MRAVGQALDQAVEERLGLGVDPVQILEDQQQRLHLALPQEQPLDGIQRPLAALGRIEGRPPGSSTGTSRSAQERRQRRLQRAVEGQDLAGHLLADRRGRSSRSLDPEVAP